MNTCLCSCLATSENKNVAAHAILVQKEVPHWHIMTHNDMANKSLVCLYTNRIWTSIGEKKTILDFVPIIFFLTKGPFYVESLHLHFCCRKARDCLGTCLSPAPPSVSAPSQTAAWEIQFSGFSVLPSIEQFELKNLIATVSFYFLQTHISQTKKSVFLPL